MKFMQKNSSCRNKKSGSCDMLHRLLNLLKNEYIFSLFTKGLMVLIGLAESALLARYLGADLRGTLSYIYSISATVYLIATFGMYTAYPFMRKNSNEEPQKIINTFMTHMTVIFLFYAVVLIIPAVLLFDKERILAIILIMIPVMGYDKIVSFIFMIESPNKTNRFTLISNIIQTLYLAVILLFFRKSLLAGVFYYILGCFIKTAYFSYKLKMKVQLECFKLKTLIGYIKFGFFPMAALLLTTLNYRLDVIMLKQFDFITYTQIGVYSIGLGLSEKALLVPDAVKEVLLSKLAKGKGEEEVARVMRVCFLASIGTALCIQILGKFVLDILYGSEYAGAEIVTYISVWGTTVMVFFKMVSQYNVIQHKQHLNVIFLTAAILLNLAANMLLIPEMGINGAALATDIGYLVSALIFLIYFSKTANIKMHKLILIQSDDVKILKSMLSSDSVSDNGKISE